MLNLIPADRLIHLSQDYPDAYLTLKMECGRCGSLIEDHDGWDYGSDVNEVLSVMNHAPETFDYIRFVGSILCPSCFEQFKKDTCLHRHPVDNHLCLKPKHHNDDHECCKWHMFY